MHSVEDPKAIVVLMGKVLSLSRLSLVAMAVARICLV